MRKLLTLFALSCVISATAMGMAQAAGTEATDALTIPVRVVAGTAGAGLGAVSGSIKGVVDTEQKFAAATFGKSGKNPLLVPVGIVGTAVAVPVGIIMGAPQGAVDGGKDGYALWDKNNK